MTRTAPSISFDLEPEVRDFYRDVLLRLQETGAPFVLAGSFASAHYTGRPPHTKDLDVFVPPGDLDATLRGLAEAGFETGSPYPHWIAKAYRGEAFVDLITRGSNGVWEVERSWLERAPEARIFDVPVRVCPLEELVWTKATILDRDRYDGNEVIRLLRAGGDGVDWERLRALVGPHWRVLLAHLALFGYAWPDAWANVPQELIEELARRFREEPPTGAGHEPPLCAGTLLSRNAWLDELEEGYRDARMRPFGTLDPEEAAPWHEAVKRGDA